MTIDEFLERLAGLGMKWELRGNSIRSVSEPLGLEHCPISAVTGDPDDITRPCAAAGDKLGMSWEDAAQLSGAADISHAVLRSRLLKACGLEAE